MRVFLLSIFLTYCCLGSAQNKIKGRIQDTTGTGVSYCVTGLLQAKDSSIVKGALGNENGNFEFTEVKAGNYLIKSSQPGFADTWHGPFVKDSVQDLELSPIVLRSMAVQLSGVDVVAIKDLVEFINGNVIVNVEGSPLAAGNSVFDLLSRLPGVMVDNESISIAGKSGVKVYIDERPQQLAGAQLLNFLRSLSASSVEKIEVISNPPARYDAAGDAGIINIKTKKLKLTGFSGNTNFNLSQGVYLGSSAGLSLNYKGKNASFFSSVNGNRRMMQYVSSSERNIQSGSSPFSIEDKSINKALNEDLVINLGADWYASDKYTFGFKYQGIPGYGLELQTGHSHYSDGRYGYENIYASKETPNDWYLANYNVNGERKLDTLGSTIKVSADYYSPYFDDYQSYFTNQFTDSADAETLHSRNFINNNLLDMEILTCRLDIHKNYKSGLELEGGVKGSWQEVSSNYVFQNQDSLSGEYVTDGNLTNRFTYREQIGAAYFSASKKIGKMNVRAALRAEQTGINTDTHTGSLGYQRAYSSFFPQGGIDYNLKSGHRYSANFNRRIERPHYNSFNPYRWVDNLITTGEGNPLLSPAYSNVLSFVYGYKSLVNSNTSFTRITNPIISYMIQNDNGGVLNWRVDNLKYLTIVRWNIFLKREIRKWYTQSFLVGAYYIDYSGDVDGQKLTVAAIPYYAWLNSVFLLPRNFKIELTGFYWGPWLGIGYRNLERGGLSMAVRKSFGNNKFNAALQVNDIFFTETWRSSTVYRNQDWYRFNSNDSRRLSFSFSYTFGKIKAEQRELQSSDEEKQRMGK